MILTIRLGDRELREIEEFVARGDVDCIHDFVRYAVQNQIQLERERVDKRNSSDYLSSRMFVENGHDGQGAPGLVLNRTSYPQNLKLPPMESKKISNLDESEVRERTRHPIWALKNRYLPTKLVLRVIQKLTSSSSESSVSISSLREEIREIAFSMRIEMQSLDERMENKRGERIATGFPMRKKDSFDRFFKNFVIYVSPDGSKVKGMPYELGFIDVVDGTVVLTDDGNTFANCHSPILDGYLHGKGLPKSQFSDDELDFLYKHIQRKAISEATLYKFMLSQMKKGANSPEDLNDAIRPFLEEKFPKKGGYSIKMSSSIRAGLTSRMVELRLIRIEKIGVRSLYEVEENGKKFMEGEI